MKLLKKVFNRYNLLSFILIILMGLLSFRLATLTIVEGDYYRDVSDNKRLKTISTTAPRGEIRDRYGRLLAGTKSSFTVQISKDELNIKDKAKKNHILLSLIRLLEEDGASYIEDFPIELNTFKYKNEEDYISEELSPSDKVIDIILENNILKDVLSTYYIHNRYSEHYKFTTVERVIKGLRDKEIEVPILVELNYGNLEIIYSSSEEETKWKKKHQISSESEPLEALVKLIGDDKVITRKILEHPISRKLIFEILEEKGIASNITLEEYELSFDEEYKEIKRTLMSTYKGVTKWTTPKEDFINIVMDSSIENLLGRVVIKENEKGKEEIFIPGEILLETISEKEEIPITFELSEDRSNVIYQYTGGEDVEESPLEILINYGKSTDSMEEFLTKDEIKILAQEQLLNDGINPRISVAKDFEYVFINNKNNWFTQNFIEEGSTPEEAFESLKETYDINKILSPYEVRGILNLYEKLNKQGHKAYQPINIAYGIKNETVAKIEEGLVEYPGIHISVEPVRYYPEGETAAHLLGYLGKISQPNEIKNYVEEKDYSPNDIIGKTGIEESFEDLLRGVNGVKKVEVDSLGNTTEVLDEVKPIPGNNVYLTLDNKLQQFSKKVLVETLDKIRVGGTYNSPWGDYEFGINNRKKRPYKNATTGAVVVIDVKTGEVLASVSYPSYDPNLFSTGISSTDWLSLFPENERDHLAPRPLYNVATQTAVQPGSTFKMVTALAALDKGFSPTKTIRDMGKVDIGTDTFGCWLWNQSRATHGRVNVYQALRDSCNYYFYSLVLGENQKTGEKLGVKVEIEDIANLSKQLGLNDKTGIEINIPRETTGGVPDPQRKIIITKNSLKNYLKNNIEKYIRQDTILTPEEIDNAIEEIVSWTEYETPLTRGEVVRRLSDMGIAPERILPGEREGIADRIKYTYLNYAGWNISDTLNVTIGQGQNSYTAIQMANFISTISNGGYRHKVSLVDNVKNYNNSKIVYKNEEEAERIELNDYENLNHVKKGMLGVTTEGTARRIFRDFPIEVGAKTGTAEKSGTNPVTGETYDDFAWFVAFAPYDEPEIAIATVIFQGGSGGYAGPMVRDIIAEYLKLNAVETKGQLPFSSGLVE